MNYYSTDPVHDASRYYDAVARYNAAMDAERERLHAETLALAKKGNYERLLSAMDYRNNDQTVMHTLVVCAAKGDADAKHAVEALARCWAEINAEVN